MYGCHSASVNQACCLQQLTLPTSGLQRDTAGKLPQTKLEGL